MNPVSTMLPGRQRGIVLLLLMALLFAVGAVGVMAALTNNQANQRSSNELFLAMNQAKESLIAYAVMHGDYYSATGAGPGHLPCPDTNGNGGENTPCATTLGRLPQAITLPSAAIMPLSDHNSDIDQQFWYALSTAFRRSPVGIANTASAGSITVDGQTGIAAIIIAPGDIVGSQSRTNNTASNYLEAGNATGPTYVTSYAVDPTNFNDRIVRISVSELMSPVTSRVVEVMRTRVQAYRVANGVYPNAAAFPAAMAGAPAWPVLNCGFKLRRQGRRPEEIDAQEPIQMRTSVLARLRGGGCCDPLSLIRFRQ